MKIHILVVSSAAAVVGTTIACSSPPNEPAASSEQRFTETNDAGADGDGGSVGCAHEICATGGPLVATCDPCTTKLCAQDPYCCRTAWDETCVGEVTSICAQSCSAPPRRDADAGESTCIHSVCATGGSLAKGCDPCVSSLCALDPYCCAVAWDATCVGEVGAICGQSCK